ncbi:hypothetical protein NPIL_255831 [Nephila pilipes]|uniref:Uncharacterized protein n=1 Tax=Nephila pilipes TaxID=299642 RepID=A0A8X6PUR6_NEPPI|nr:hypothetical protein NPIL_255831 [Nephila pilipes]
MPLQNHISSPFLWMQISPSSPITIDPYLQAVPQSLSQTQFVHFMPFNDFVNVHLASIVRTLIPPRDRINRFRRLKLNYDCGEHPALINNALATQTPCIMKR